jgi:hypothetical protein
MAGASLVVAIVSLLVALSSALFSVVAWWRGGSLVRIQDTEGFVFDSSRAGPARERDLPIEGAIFVTSSEIQTVRLFRIVNVGRQATALLEWWIDMGGTMQQGLMIPDKGVQATALLPVTLEPGHLVELGIPWEWFRNAEGVAGRILGDQMADPRLVVRLGTGKDTSSDRRSIPAPHPASSSSDATGEERPES